MGRKTLTQWRTTSDDDAVDRRCRQVRRQVEFISEIAGRQSMPAGLKYYEAIVGPLLIDLFDSYVMSDVFLVHVHDVVWGTETVQVTSVRWTLASSP